VIRKAVDSAVEMAVDGAVDMAVGQRGIDRTVEEKEVAARCERG
jgi:hypothetical protein